MTSDGFGTLFDFVIWAGCLYCLYSWLWMRKYGKIHENPLLIPSKFDISDCKDKEGYLQYISPRLFIFSLIGIALGGINLYGGIKGFPRDIMLAVIAALFINIIWFAVTLRNGLKRYWNL